MALVQKPKGLQQGVADIDTEVSQPDCETGLVSPDHDDDPFVDEELKKYGGRYDRKICVGQVTIRLPLDWYPLNILALVYGFLPWVIPLAFAVSFVSSAAPHFFEGWKAGLQWMRVPCFSAYGTYLSTSLALVNECVLKPLIKQDRPRQSANRYKNGMMKPGMPSGHVLNAVSLMVWSLFEVSAEGPGLSSPWACLICSMAAPVAWARWYTRDHTVSQCLVSAVLGVACGTLAFFLRVEFYGPYTWVPWGLPGVMPEVADVAASTAAVAVDAPAVPLP
mmetsp:Transcript_5991/g.13208  ORF Transcript_5991/g.13208 Transcript_5991/m.13208 type:complete len:278 (+) Transcript_5991:126-959(+)|eukprot:CAMPEP_0178381146 /NCGR_PEP_ID=MMETSP0689_2-20121128/5831_1 /TAXON_ID=160604 /ORGANISM="Amphidinium massartii, Strain CS-259" /LENGTH=277 /DNA_ID=CAMNT_0020001317 /DNA_START=66 /DNA_END=899 /DNA_ORIENTATION=+